MKNKLEEKLAMLAFGDLSPEDTARLENEVAEDGEARRILNQYRGMRLDLKAMAEVPEHQLSTDRLRHAILNEGMKRTKPRPQFGWLWMPAAVCALVFGGLMLRDRNSALPVAIKAPTNDSVVTDYPGSEFAFATAGGEILSVGGDQVAPSPAPQIVSRRSYANRSKDNERDLEILKERVMEEFQNTMMASQNPTNASMSLASAPAASERAVPAAAPIVLIDSAKDKSTGAQRATEVDSASNVVVGG